ncbi:MAG: hypothetical protein RQ745_08545 [Longimicrobiales bacterium]|nr:hypothetical protein [Longimicrobiales bacterium]
MRIDDSCEGCQGSRKARIPKLHGRNLWREVAFGKRVESGLKELFLDVDSGRDSGHLLFLTGEEAVGEAFRRCPDRVPSTTGVRDE